MTLAAVPDTPPMSAATAAPGAPQLPEALLHKAIAIRLQLQNYAQAAELARAQLRIAELETARLAAGLPPVETELLAALEAPAGARFDWQTFGWTQPDGKAGG
jgi:hypothetical protein